jgi:hypothetical protein
MSAETREIRSNVRDVAGRRRDKGVQPFPDGYKNLGFSSKNPDSTGICGCSQSAPFDSKNRVFLRAFSIENDAKNRHHFHFQSQTTKSVRIRKNQIIDKYAHLKINTNCNLVSRGKANNFFVIFFSL